jgi:hypothetical protein
VVTFEGAGLQLGTAIAPGGKVYLEVLSGSLEGERIDINEAATTTSNNGTVTLDLGVSYNTISPTANALLGATCAIRSHVTLAKIQALFTPALAGDNNAAKADRIYLFEGGSWVRYSLRGDKVSWRKTGYTDDQSGTVIPPGAGILVELLSAPKSAVQVGSVRMNAFRYNLGAGYQCFAPPYPVSLSPTQMAAFVDANDPVGVRWTGQNNADLADTISPFSAGSFIRYNLRSDGTSWRKSGDQTNYAGSEIVLFNEPTLVKRTNPDAGYVVIRPFAP